MRADIFSCQNWVVSLGIWLAEVKDAGECLTMHRTALPPTKNHPAPNVNRAQVEKSWFSEISMLGNYKARLQVIVPAADFANEDESPAWFGACDDFKGNSELQPSRGLRVKTWLISTPKQKITLSNKRNRIPPAVTTLAETLFRMDRHRAVLQRTKWSQSVERDGTLQRQASWDTNPTGNEISRQCFMDMMEENETSSAIQQVKMLLLTLSSHQERIKLPANRNEGPDTWNNILMERRAFCGM